MTAGDRRVMAAMLLMREVICEQIYRHRRHWDADHPNRMLRVREITPAELHPFVEALDFEATSRAIRAKAGDVLDQLEAKWAREREAIRETLGEEGDCG